ncbi:MAG: CDP-paratose 2-epimerase [Acidobacteria bacterium]|nr:MAG: CDP-paratose 2-epimerase [Acidobacteriota bacterium]PYY02524.1 MAG: CDP-paratose 2-epimerase [Acidobacteriota bacterium]PYY23033.1 MAG: CDP-paratose 2-epimerase [Acidobacteriota bacterium]
MDSNHSERRSVLIFGGAGFIGANLAQYVLLETEASVHVFDNLSRRGVQHNLELLRKAAGRSGRLRVTVADVRNASAVERACGEATEIYQFAAQVAVTSSITNPRCDFETNIIGTFNILEGARLSGNQPFILFTSTNKVYGEMLEEQLELRGGRYAYAHRTCVSEEQPLDFHSPYGCSKGSADQYAREYSRMYGLPTVVFRMSCIAGEMQYGNEDQGWVAHFLYTALRGGRLVIYGDGYQVRDVLHVKDLVRAFDAVRTSLPQTAGQIYNVGGGPENTISLMELIDEIEVLTGERLEYTTGPRRAGDQQIYVSDYSKLARHTGWKPRSSVRQTLAAIHQFWQEHREFFGDIPVRQRAEPVLSPTLLERAA